MSNDRLSRLSVLIVLSCVIGCGQTFGGLLHAFNLVPRPRQAARYKLTKGRLLILVDDTDELLTWMPARDLLATEVAKNLREARANTRAVADHEIDVMRRSDTKFEQRSISELGEKFGAEQVLWLQVKEFLASTQVESVSRAARFAVRVKVFDPRAKSKSEMRVWPSGRAGEYISVDKSAADVQEQQTNEDVARMLVTDLGRTVAELFYNHVVRD